MQFMNWDKHMAGIRTDNDQRSLLLQLTATPHKVEPGYSKVQLLFMEYIQTGQVIIHSSSQGLTV
jgi:hypothetical protein